MIDGQDLWGIILQPLNWIKWAKDQGLWDFITAGSGLLISAFVLRGQKKKIPEFSVHLSYSLGRGTRTIRMSSTSSCAI